jgi:aspartyl-tRNA(Asn)/glutamyl-tRNA(Gln) amidotransferase subunit C
MSTQRITEKDIDRLAELARIDVPESEKKSLLGEIDGILNYVDQVKNAPINYDPTETVGAVKNITRSDEVISTSDEDRKRLIDEAPKKEGEFIAVKKIIS